MAHEGRKALDVQPFAILDAAQPPAQPLPVRALGMQGNIAKYVANVGDELAVGDRLAEIETDKATVDFEMADDGVLAKILLPEGASDIPVGTPMVVLVDDVAHVAAFADFTVDAAPAAEAAPAAPAPAPAAADCGPLDASACCCACAGRRRHSGACVGGRRVNAGDERPGLLEPGEGLVPCVMSARGSASAEGSSAARAAES